MSVCITVYDHWSPPNAGLTRAAPQDGASQQWPSKRSLGREGSTSVEDMLLPQTGSTETLDDVMGMEDAKQILHEAVIMPIQYPQLFQGK